MGPISHLAGKDVVYNDLLNEECDVSTTDLFNVVARPTTLTTSTAAHYFHRTLCTCGSDAWPGEMAQPHQHKTTSTPGLPACASDRTVNKLLAVAGSYG